MEPWRCSVIKLAPSSLERYEACPGSYWAEQGMPWVESEYAEEGNLLHKAMYTEGMQLSTEHQRLVRICREAGRQLLVDYLKGSNQFAHESYLPWQTKKFKVSGKLDFMAWDEEAALIIDWKFGREPVEVAESNLQLRAYACLMNIHYPRERCVVAIVQPYAEPERRVTVCGYSKRDIELSIEQITEIAAAIETHRELRKPGPSQCRYCKAAATDRCPESRENVSGLVEIVKREVLMPSGEELAGWLDRAKAAESVIQSIKDHAVAELQAGREVPGWRLGKMQTIRTLPDAAKAWEAASAVLDPAEFTEACKVTVGALQDVMAEKKRWSSREAKENFNAVMGSALVAGERRGSLERIK